MTAIKYSTQFKKDYKSLTVSDQKSVDNAILKLVRVGSHAKLFGK